MLDAIWSEMGQAMHQDYYINCRGGRMRCMINARPQLPVKSRVRSPVMADVVLALPDTSRDFMSYDAGNLGEVKLTFHVFSVQ